MKPILPFIMIGVMGAAFLLISPVSSYPDASEGNYQYSDELRVGNQLIWDVNEFNISYSVSPELYTNSIINITILKDPNTKVNSTSNDVYDAYDYFNIDFDGVQVKSVWRGTAFPYYFWHGSCNGSCWDAAGGFELNFLWKTNFIYNNGTEVDWFDLLEDSLGDNSEYIIYSFSKEKITIEYRRDNYTDFTAIDRSSGIMLERSGSYYAKLLDDTIWYYNFDIKLRNNGSKELVKAPQMAIFLSIFITAFVLRKKRCNRPIY